VVDKEPAKLHALKGGAGQEDAAPREAPPAARSRGIFLLPNLITSGALFSGFYAIVASMNGNFEAAAMALFAAMILDAADGRVARLTRTESAFGAQYDSLSDMVAFGVAPALLVFAWSLQSLGQAGWVATFIYMACAALRLARFNMQDDHAIFVGLASPAAAALLAGLVWTFTENAPRAAGPDGLGAAALAIYTAGVGLLMVSPLRYWSPKTIRLAGRVPFFTLVAIVLAYAGVMLDPPRMLLGGVVIYAASGPVMYFLQRARRRRAAAEKKNAETR